MMQVYDWALDNNNSDILDQDDPDKIDNQTSPNFDKDNDNLLTDSPKVDTTDTPHFLDHFIHVIQFCHLCHKGKIPAVNYKLSLSQEISK
jgi:hypothetical protein